MGAMILLHGLGADATYWAAAAAFLARQGRTVILPDAPGSGRSEPPASEEGYGLDGRVAALDSLARALALPKSDFVGHSLGGWTAAWFALKFPWKVGRLVLVDSAGLSLPEDVDAARALVGAAQDVGAGDPRRPWDSSSTPSGGITERARRLAPSAAWAPRTASSHVSPTCHRNRR